MSGKFLMGIFVLALAASSANADITTGLVAHYRFEGNTGSEAGVDGIAFGEPGYVTGVLTGPDAGGRAIDLDGIDDYIYFPHAEQTTSAGTVAFWVNFDVEPEHNSVLYYAENTGGWQLGQFNTWVSNLDHAGAGPLPGACATIIGGNGLTPWDRSKPLHFTIKPNEDTLGSLNQWHHIALTYETGRYTQCARMYVNGVETFTQTPKAAQELLITPAALGAAVTDRTPANFQNAAFDDLRIYSRALSPGDVVELVPEPAIMTLLGLGGLTLLRSKR